MNDSEKLDQIFEMLKNINTKVDKLEKNFSNLTDKQKDIEKSTSRKDNHIDIVENTYNSLKAP